MRVAGGDRGHAGEAARHAALPVVVDGAAPGDDGAVTLQGQAVRACRRRSRSRRRGRSARCTARSRRAAAAPGDDGAVALQGQAVSDAGGDRGHAGQAARHAALPVVASRRSPRRRRCRRPSRPGCEYSPAAIAVTPERPLGTVHCPQLVRRRSPRRPACRATPPAPRLPRRAARHSARPARRAVAAASVSATTWSSAPF